MKSFHAFLVRTLILLCIMFFASSSLFSQAVVFKNGVQQGVVKVKFKPTMTTTLGNMRIQTRGNVVTTGVASLDKATRSLKANNMRRLFPYDAQIEHKFKKHGLDLWYVIDIDENTDLKTAITTLQSLEEVDVAECRYEKVIEPSVFRPYEGTPNKARATQPFNDPLLPDQWHYYNTGQTGYPGGAHINLFEAWNKTAGRGDIIVSVHDEGMDVNHEDLKANMWVNTKELNGVAGADDDGNGYIDDIHGFNFVNGTGNIDPEKHGTHVAGTVAAVNNNNIGVSGVAGGTGKGDGVKIMALQVIGNAATDIESTYIYAAKNGAVISQNSWGYRDPDYYEQSVLDGIDFFIAEAGDYPNSPMKGGIVIFAAGNENLEADWYPGVYKSTFSVAALGPEWKRASYSNYGAWVDISAPGGDSGVYGEKNGVLSTFPNNTYGYYDGTSMACPHVSGIAALIIANSNGQTTNEVVWNKLLVGAVPDMYQVNANYIGKLGKGAIDAAFAISEDAGKVPLKITDLKIRGIAPSLADLAWKVPKDEDDDYPSSFYIYHSTQEITAENIASLNPTLIKNTDVEGVEKSFDVEELLANTKYWFAVISADRWGNKSVLSNVVTASTNTTPKIEIEEQSVNHLVNVVVSPTASSLLHIANTDANVGSTLKWESEIRTTYSYLDYMEYQRNILSKLTPRKTPLKVGAIKRKETPVVRAEKSSTFAATAFETQTKQYYQLFNTYVGDKDIERPTSGAIKFVVDEENGFNLTNVNFYLNHQIVASKVSLEIYRDELNKKNLVTVQDCTPGYVPMVGEHFVTLDEQLYFEKGSSFYIAIHVTPGTLYPLGLGVAQTEGQVQYNYYSDDLGETWVPLSSVVDYPFPVWMTSAVSQTEPYGAKVTLTPVSGKVNGTEKAEVTVQSDGSQLRNGTYYGNLLVSSNDLDNPEVKIPLELKVEGHKSKVVSPKLVEFGNVFQGSSKTIDVIIDNEGYGVANDFNCSVDNSANFTLSDTYIYSVPALGQERLSVTLNPVDVGNINGQLTISNGNQTLKISLFGIGAETSIINVTPTEQDVVVAAIGDKVSAEIEVENLGKYPLKYFIPGYDDNGIGAEWPTDFHKYGYGTRSSNNASNPLTYEFEDISTTGINITGDFLTLNTYKTIKLPFAFPFYDTEQHEVHTTQMGYITFDKSMNPPTSPTVGMEGGIKSYISLFGEMIDLAGDDSGIYSEVRADKLILQYQGYRAWGGDDNYIVAQMVLHSNGDIRFYFKKAPMDTYFFYLLIEDLEQKDPVIIKDIDTTEDLGLIDGSAFGFDYPGPNVIESIENGSGIVHPGSSEIIKVNIDTKTLIEGITKRYINIVNNDPKSPNALSLINLDVRGGGNAEVVVSETAYDFGIIYKDFPYTHLFGIANTGNKQAAIESFTFYNNKFTVAGASLIKAKLTEEYTITANTDAVGKYEDKLVIKFTDGTSKSITLKAEVLLAPVATTDVSPLEEVLNLEETKSHDFGIENTGDSDLTLSVMGTTWARFEEDASAQSMLQSYKYSYVRHNKGEPTYNWIDIIKTGTFVPNLLIETPRLVWGWEIISLPFTFKYYDKDYDKMKITGNGIVSFDENPELQLTPGGGLPFKGNAYIMPFWFNAADNPSAVPGKTTGLFYQSFNSSDKKDTDVNNHDMLVVSWEDMISSSGVGKGISFQMILYKNGTIQFQHRLMTDPMLDVVTNIGYVGFQNSQDEYTVISGRNKFNFGAGLAYLIAPTNDYIIPKGKKITGKLTFDSRPVYAGVFEDALKIYTNDPAKETQIKPLKLTVNGETSVSIPELIDFGVVQQREEAYYLFLPVKNTGSSMVQITNMALVGMPFGPFTPEVFYAADGGVSDWTNVRFLGGKTFDIRPGETFDIRIKLSVGGAMEYARDFAITTSAGTYEVSLKGIGYMSAIMELDTDNFDIYVENTTPVAKNINVANKGDYKLDYTTQIQYVRSSGSALSPQRVLEYGRDSVALTSSSVEVTEIAPRSTRAEDEVEKMFHTGTDTPTHIDGMTGGVAKGTYATRFTAGADGYNLSDVFTYFRGENIREGIIEVEVRAGNSNIRKATTVGTATMQYYSETEDIKGAWYQIRLKEPIVIYPNEEFFVMFTYPAPLRAPQGVAHGPTVEQVANRYLTYFEELWYDVQVALPNIYFDGGWSIGVGQRDKSKIGWLSILTNDKASIPVDEAIKVDLEIKPQEAQPGDQTAIITFDSNDTETPQQEVTVNLRVNDAPIFENAPTAIYVLETETSNIQIKVSDKENHEFEVVNLGAPAFTTYAYDKASKTISLISKPQVGNKGNYVVKLKATDALGLSRELEMPLIVNNVNRAPIFIGETGGIVLSITGGQQQLNINNLFEDPDGDAITYVVESSDPSILAVYQGASNFFNIEGIAEGTAQLKFVVSDPYNAITTEVITVTVSPCVDPYDIIYQKWNSVLLVDNSRNQYKTTGYQWYKNGLPLKDETKPYYTTEELDFTAEYHVQVTTKDGAIFYTCPMTPEHRDYGLKVYPNPVKAGEIITIEANIEGIESKPMSASIIGLNGNTLQQFVVDSKVKTITAPSVANIYLLSFDVDGIIKTFKIVVK